MTGFLPSVEPPPARPPKLDYGSTGRYWLLTIPVIVGSVTLLPWPYKPAGAFGVWLFATVWMVLRAARRQLGPALLQGKGGNNRWIIGLDLWSIDMFVTMGVTILAVLVSVLFHSNSSMFVGVIALSRVYLLRLAAIPLLSRWGVPHKQSPLSSDRDRDFSSPDPSLVL